MEDVPVTHYLEHLVIAIIKFFLLTIALPLIPVFIFNLSIPAVLTLMTSTFLIEYGAAPIGIGLGLSPLFVIYVLICIATGVILFLFDIFDTFGEHSEKVSNFLKKSSERAKESKVLSKYGMYGLIPCVMILGFYVCPPIVWVFGWRRDFSILTIMTGYITISIITALFSMGIIVLLFR
ncbi:MAG: small multi-drug export protein [Methanoregulaceae archaeon]|jgi:uncharacterized membrane protein